MPEDVAEILKTESSICAMQNLENDNGLTKLECAKPTQEKHSVAASLIYQVEHLTTIKQSILPHISSRLYVVLPPTRENPPKCVIHYSDPFLNLPSGRLFDARQVSAMYLPSTGSTRRVVARTNRDGLVDGWALRGQQRVFLFGDAKLNTCIIPS